MGLTRTRLIFWGLFFVLFTGVTDAAPKLRLETATVGPISIAVGQNGPRQTVEARNAGDGALALTLEASADWLAAVAAAPRACSSGQGICIPIRISLNTAALAKGIYTGIVAVKDPDAVDTPQSITVTVQMGGGVPDQINFFIAPNGSSDSVSFKTNSKLSHWSETQSGGGWLSLALEGSGSFDFVLPYRIEARYHPGLAEGIHHGTVHITGSDFAPDKKNVPVTLRVTSQPIANLGAEKLNFRIAKDALPVNQYVTVWNRGLGTLTLNSVTATAGNDGTWLTAEIPAGASYVKVTADPKDLDPGDYEGTVTIESNAVNGPHVVPVRLTVEEQGAPLARVGGVVNNATFQKDEPVAQGGIVALFGDQLSFEGPKQGTELPLVHELGGVKVYVNGQEAPLYFTSYGQVNFQIPYEIPAGEATVQVMRGETAGNKVSVQIAGRAPRLLRLNIGEYGIIVNQDGSFPIPPTPGVNSHPARPGDYLVIYAIGLGPTSPPVASGEAAPLDPLAWTNPKPDVYFGGGLIRVKAIPLYAGLTPKFVGLYQINVQIPPNAPKGMRVPLAVIGWGVSSNIVEIAIE